MEPFPSIAKVCTKLKIGEQKSDFAYWQTQPYARRLAALEEIRREFHRWKYDAEPGFQRVYSIVKRSGELKKTKKAAGRLQDLADLENLQ